MITPAPIEQRLRLCAGEWVCEVAPALGGAIMRLGHGGRDILRRASADATHPFSFSSFAMLPYANRIAGGRVAVAGSTFVLPPNISGEAHPLHGIGMLRPWSVRDQEADRLVLGIDHPGSKDWPCAFAARQEIALSPNGMTHGVELRNTDRAPFPAGLGFHPYFAQSSGAKLTGFFDGVWTVDRAQLPVSHAVVLPRDWRQGAPVRGSVTIDNCHSGWNGAAQIVWDSGLEVAIRASANLGHLHIYAPTEEDFFCLEPVSHRPDAVNGPEDGPGAMTAVQPGETMRAWMRLELTAPVPTGVFTRGDG